MQAEAVVAEKASQYKIFIIIFKPFDNSSKGFLFYWSFFGAGGGGGSGGEAGGIGGVGGILNSATVTSLGATGAIAFISGGGGGGGGNLCFFWENTAIENNSILPVRQIFNRFIIKIFARMQKGKNSIKKIPQMRDFTVGFGKLSYKSVRLLF